MPKIKRIKSQSLAKQVKAKVKDKKGKEVKSNTKISYNGDRISTGSLLLDLACGGPETPGMPGGIMVVGYGPSGSGKTVLACEIAGNILRSGGELDYKDSEARLNKDFAAIFGLKHDEMKYDRPNTIPEAIRPLYKWQVDKSKINGYIIDSLAALSTDTEMDNEDGDKMGMRRAKEFSEHLRKGARIVAENNILLFCTNQIREKADAQKFERKDINPGGKAIEFYASLIFRFSNIKPIRAEVNVAGKKVKRDVGMEATIEVVKSSIWKPHRSAPIILYFDYGIDDIRANLQYIKDFTANKVYQVKDIKLSNSMDEAIKQVEEQGLERKLRKQVIELWTSIEDRFKIERKRKER